MNKVNLNTISLNSSSLNAIGEVKMGGASDGGGLDAIGVFIYDIDGKLTAPEDWDSANNNKAVGVYVGTDAHRFVIAKENVSSSWISWGGYKKTLESIPTLSNRSQATLDFDGQGNTTKIINELNGYTDSRGILGAPACEACANYTFPNSRNGYLGSAGEWQMCLDNKTAIVEAMSKCGGVTITYNLWTSTQHSDTNSWVCLWGDGYLNHLGRYSTYYVRAFLSV